MQNLTLEPTRTETTNPPIQGPTIIPEGFTNQITFNVMPGKPVQETLTIQRYEIEGDTIRAIFDREYSSSMEKSPSHLIFLSTLVHSQKLAYALLCNKLGLLYEPEGPELIKLWAYEFQIQLPKLVIREKDLVQEMRLLSLQWIDEKRFNIEIETNVGQSATYRIKAAVFLNS